MPEYVFVFDMVPKEDVIRVPEEARGLTVDTFSDHVTLKYLLPLGHPALEEYDGQ